MSASSTRSSQSAVHSFIQDLKKSRLSDGADFLRGFLSTSEWFASSGFIRGLFGVDSLLTLRLSPASHGRVRGIIIIVVASHWYNSGCCEFNQ